MENSDSQILMISVTRHKKNITSHSGRLLWQHTHDHTSRSLGLVKLGAEAPKASVLLQLKDHIPIFFGHTTPDTCVMAGFESPSTPYEILPFQLVRPL